jgi:preprotein translocase subunit SecG
VSYLKIFVTILHIAISLFVIASVMLQPAKVQGLSKTISGGAETFFGRNKGRSYEGKLQKMTEIAMVLFVISSMALVYFSNH